MSFQVASAEELQAVINELNMVKEEIKALKSSPLYLEWVTLKQAAKLMNKCYQTVSKMCKDGELQYMKEGRTIEVYYPSIIEYKTKLKIH